MTEDQTTNGYTVIHRPHVCSKPDKYAINTGTVIECNGCGKRWRLNWIPHLWVQTSDQRATE